MSSEFMGPDFWDDRSIRRTSSSGRRPVCGVDCHRSEKRQARVAAACCALVIAFVAGTLFYWPHHHAPGMPWAPSVPAGSSHIYPHNPGVGAAVIAGGARGAVHAAGHAARWGFRGAMLGRRGGFSAPGFHGYGFGLFGL